LGSLTLREEAGWVGRYCGSSLYAGVAGVNEYVCAFSSPPAVAALTAGLALCAAVVTFGPTA
jgi:hypothetical protein